MTGNMTRRPGRKVTRRIEQPRGLPVAVRTPTRTAIALMEAHNEAVRDFGSDSGGYHAYRPSAGDVGVSAGVWDGGPFPADTVVTPLAWGRIDETLAQRLLEADGWKEVA